MLALVRSRNLPPCRPSFGCAISKIVRSFVSRAKLNADRLIDRSELADDKQYALTAALTHDGRAAACADTVQS